jgi:hypothetical protein
MMQRAANLFIKQYGDYRLSSINNNREPIKNRYMSSIQSLIEKVFTIYTE